MKKKNEKKLTIAIIVFMIVVVGLTSFAIYSKLTGDSEKDNDTTENNFGLNKNLIANMEDLTYIVGYLSYRGEATGTNILSNADKRLEFIDYILSYDGTSHTTDPRYQSAAYASQYVYMIKYSDIYGSNYDFYSDSENVTSPMVYNNCSSYNDSELQGSNYVCWNDTWGVVGPITVDVTNKDYKDNIYTLTGNFSKRSDDGEVLSSGNFEINYKVDGNKAYLTSVIMK